MTTSRSRKNIGGPKTPEGKRRSSMNALKHGLRAKSPQAAELVSAYFPIDRDRTLWLLVQEFCPRTREQWHLVRKLYDLVLERAKIEAMMRRLKMLNPDLSPCAQPYLKLKVSTCMLENRYDRAVKQLRRLQKELRRKMQQTNSKTHF